MWSSAAIEVILCSVLPSGRSSVSIRGMRYCSKLLGLCIQLYFFSFSCWQWPTKPWQQKLSADFDLEPLDRLTSYSLAICFVWTLYKWFWCSTIFFSIFLPLIFKLPWQKIICHLSVGLLSFCLSVLFSKTILPYKVHSQRFSKSKSDIKYSKFSLMNQIRAST